MTRTLTEEDKEAAFIQATGGMMARLRDIPGLLDAGMTDAELSDALHRHLGIMGGRGGPDCISLAYQGAGLKIWASWNCPNIVTDKPLFEGRVTLAMARHVYGIPDPNNRQLSFLYKPGTPGEAED
jgi:hypothetical protein